MLCQSYQLTEVIETCLFPQAYVEEERYMTLIASMSSVHGGEKKRLESVWNVCWKQDFCLRLLPKITFFFQSQVDVYIEGSKYLFQVLRCISSLMYNKHKTFQIW